MKFKNFFLRWGVPLLAVGMLLFAISFIFKSKPDHSPTQAALTPATPPDYMKQTSFIAGAGVVEPASELMGIGTYLPGIVQKIHVNKGTQVKQGDPLFTIDDRDIQAQVLLQEAALAVAKKNRDLAEVTYEQNKFNFDLYENLTDKRAISEQEYMNRKFALEASGHTLKTALAQIKQAEAALYQAHVTQERHTVRAPIDGSILQVNIHLGEFAPASAITNPLLLMGAIDPLHVRIDIDEADIARLAIGGKASIAARDQTSNRIEVSFVRVEPYVIPKKSLTNSGNERVDTRVLQVIYKLPHDHAGIYAGQQVDAFLEAKNPLISRP